MLIAVVAVVVIVVLAALALTGVFGPGGGGTAPSGPPVPYSAAAPLAPSATYGVPDGPWSLVAAEGVGIAAPAPQTNLTSIGADGCTFTAVPGGETEVSVPATPSGAPPGEFAVWVFFAKNPSQSAVLMVAVGGGASRPLALISGCGVVSDFSMLGTLPASGLVDSTTIAAEFDQQGGTSFLQNETLGLEYFLLIAGFAGTGNTPVWDVTYSTCTLTSHGVPGSSLSGDYLATNGTVVTPPRTTPGTCS
jgi:hypothetical protein